MSGKFRPWIPFACSLLLCVIPLNIYVIGDYLASGVQWALFRYQVSPLGNSLIALDRDGYYITNGILTGSGAVSTLVWIAGGLLLVLALICGLASWIGHAVSRLDNHRALLISRAGGAFTLLAALLFFCSMAIQYGLMLHSDHGFSIPLGIPVVLVAGAVLLHGDPAGFLQSGLEPQDKAPDREETSRTD